MPHRSAVALHPETTAHPEATALPSLTAAPVSLQMRRAQLVAGEAARSSAPIWEPVHPSATAPPTTSSVLHAERSRVAPSLALEPAILDVLMRPPRGGESHHAAGLHREHELRALFAQLGPLEAFHLGRRLDRAASADPLIRAWARIGPDRRQRLRALLRDPRRSRG